VSQGRNGNGAAAFTFYTLPHPGVTNPGVTITVTVSETVTPIFSFSQDWRYNQTANLNGQPWKAYDYAAESSWPHGPGLLFVEKNVPQSLQGTALTLGRLTYYFRTHFTYDADPTSNTRLQFYLYVDDGAVIYLNGYELSPRLHMGGGTVTYSTLASSHEFSLEGPFEVAVSSLPAGTLKHGDNCLAVEVHQVNSTSTDIVWGMSLNIKETVVTTSTTIVNPIPDAIVALAGSGGG
jgi:hypothetical protein